MRNWTVSLLLLSLAITIVSPFSTLAQKPRVEDQDDRIVIGTSEVILDAVVKDKKGRPVRDLKASDFEVFEDGVPQQVKSFRLVTRAAAPQPNTNSGTNAGAKPDANIGATSGNPITAKSPSEARPAAPIRSTNRIGALALVFDRLSPDARNVARTAALDYLKDGMHPDDFVGVFGIDLSLKVLQPFTNKEELVRQAIDRGVSHGSSNYASNTEQIASLSDQQAALQTQIDQGSGSAGEGNDNSNAIGTAAAAQQFAAMTQNILEGFDRLEKNQQGYATTDGLLSIINEMGRLPGRKALVFFSEGVVLPTTVMAHYRSVISNANRANVSIYSVDAAGLRAVSNDAQTGSALTKLGQARLRQAGLPRDAFGSMSQDLERNEELMRSDPDGALGDLANETGGVLIANTNDPGKHLVQVTEDLHSYYLLTYVPQNQHYDGRFRQVSLKVNRSGVDVQTRKGYYAIDTSYGAPVMSYEAPALALLSGNPQANAFNSRAGAFSFPESNQPGLVPVVVEVPASAVTFAIDKEKRYYHTDFSVVVLIKDESQRVVRKLSNQYLLSGPLDKLASTKRDNVIFYREENLEPGRYTFGSVVYDAINGQASTNSGTVLVPPSDQAMLRLSSIVLVKSAERSLADSAQARHPFQFGEAIIYPNLGEPVSKSVNKEMTVFVTIYPAQGDVTAPKLRLQIAKGGHAVGQLSYNLSAPDKTGRIQYASKIALEKFQPGEYELKISVEDGTHSAERTEHVQVAP